jgi:hydroxymethylpyrimidine pyrophosphatase-like HAD family hydrolase
MERVLFLRRLIMDICFDIDGVLCFEGPTFKHSLATPLPDAIRTLEALRLAGHRIILFTSRSWSEYELTEKWLREHNFHYHVLICGKPVYDMIVDDRAIAFTSWKDALEKIEEKGKK